MFSQHVVFLVSGVVFEAASSQKKARCRELRPDLHRDGCPYVLGGNKSRNKPKTAVEAASAQQATGALLCLATHPFSPQASQRLTYYHEPMGSDK